MSDLLPAEPVINTPPLTAADDNFCLAIVEYGGNLGAAYRAAFGDHVSNPAARARDLLCRPEIAKRINQLSRSVEESALISLGSHLESLARLRDKSEQLGMMNAAITAEVKRGEAAGYYKKMAQSTTPDQPRPSVTINIGAGTPVSVEEWSQKYGPKSGEVIDVPAK